MLGSDELWESRIAYVAQQVEEEIFMAHCPSSLIGILLFIIVLIDSFG